MHDDKKTADVKLSDGTIIKMEYASQGGRRQVGKDLHVPVDFHEVFATVKTLASDMQGLVQQSKARKATVEFGVELSAGTGKLTELIVKGSGKATFKFTFEWETTETRDLK